MAAKTCSVDSCDKRGELVCTGFKGAWYCSKVCQKLQWKTHKGFCPAAQTHKCYLIRAPPNGVIGNVSTLIEPFDLRRYGDERGECKELEERLGWTKPMESGKFYDHVGSDEWYYWVYADYDAKASGKPLNALWKRLCYQQCYGDLVVLRSGPAGAIYPEQFTRSALAKTVEFYETENRNHVFSERARNRTGRKWGIDLSGVKHAHFRI